MKSQDIFLKILAIKNREHSFKYALFNVVKLTTLMFELNYPLNEKWKDGILGCYKRLLP